MSALRYRITRWVAMSPGFADMRFLIAVHAMSVRALLPAEIRFVAKLNQREVTALLVELKGMNVLAVEVSARGDTARWPGTAAARSAAAESVATIGRILSGATRARAPDAVRWVSTMPVG